MEKELAEEMVVLAKIANGDQQAFGTLFHFYRNKVYGYAFGMLHNEGFAEEIVQNVFIKLWVKRDNLIKIERFGAFLRTVVKNETLNLLKKIATEKRNSEYVGLTRTEIDSDTENEIQYRETRRLIANAIENLSAQQKLIYSLCKIEGLNQKEVANKLKISPQTVKTHLRDAVRAIKNQLNMHQAFKLLPFFLFFLK